ncbi:MAG: hypothetical protein K8W52_45410 [Deltaproteobacteria bacterium]|nr:hypothetical protein [Deltaproteobacteria bacterium]
MGLFDRLFAKKAPAAPPVLDTSEANLRAVLGDDNVMIASGLAIESVAETQPGREQVGGLPAGIGAASWPRCAACQCLMTFIGQVAVGPDEQPSYPERGSLAIFRCNAEPPPSGAPCAANDASGSVCFFVTANHPPEASAFSDEERLQIERALAQAHAAPSPRRAPFSALSERGYRGQPVLDHAYRVERRRVVSCRAPQGVGLSAAAANALWAAARAASGVAIEIGGFPDWIQAPIDDLRCACGAPMELIVQYEAFDDAINLGDAGRAYVFACAQRCSPTSFTSRWDCC